MSGTGEWGAAASDAARIARIVMGWKFTPSDEGGYFWDENISIAEEFWNPTEEIHHTMMVVNKLLKLGYRVTLDMAKDFSICNVHGYKYAMTGFSETTGLGNSTGIAVVHAVLHMIDDGEFGEEKASV